MLDFTFVYIKLNDLDGDTMGVSVTYTGENFDAKSLISGVYLISQQVSFNATTNKVTLASHGFSNGSQISFSTVSGSIGVNANTVYTVVYDFEVDGLNTFSLSGVDVTANGTGIIKTRSGTIGEGSGQISYSNLSLIPLSMDDVDFVINYTGGVEKLSVTPQNVGRYDFNVASTYKKNTACNGYFTSDYYENGKLPAGLPTWRGTGKDVEKVIDWNKFLIILPMPIVIDFINTEKIYDGIPDWPTYKVRKYNPDPNATPEYIEDLEVRVTYSYSGELWWKSGEYASGSGTVVATSTEELDSIIPPVEVGEYQLEAKVVDWNHNYVGKTTGTYTISPRTPDTKNPSGYTDEEEYEYKLSLLSDDTKTDITSKQFLTNATLKILDSTDIINLDKVTSLADCAKNLPEKLLNAAMKKAAQLILNYLPGLGIVQLLTSALKLIQQVQQVLALIEQIRKNPLTFLDAVLEANGVYDKIGDAIDGAVGKIAENFPGVGNAIGIATNAVNGLIDFCETENFDSLGNIIPKSTKADDTKTPEAVKGFTPAVSRQPVEQKVNYDSFLYHIKEITTKDSAKIESLSKLTDKTKLNEYLSMITTVNELAFSLHDSIAAKATAKGLLDATVVSFNTSSDSSGSSTIDSIVSGLGGTLDKANSFISLAGATSSTTSSVSAVNTANNALSSVASSIDGVTNSIGSVGSLLSGGSSLSEFLDSFNSGLDQAASSVNLSSEFSTFDKEVTAAIERNPKWSSETIVEFRSKMKGVKEITRQYKNDILNNPLFAKATSSNATSTGDTTTSGSTASLASLKNETETTQFNRMKPLILASSLNQFKPSDGAKYGITSGSADEWALFFTKLGVKESGLRNGVVGDVGKFTGNSNGLYQLSPLDYSTYKTHMRAAGIQNATEINGQPAFSNAQLQDPDINSKAAVVIAEVLIRKSGAIGSDASTGMARYWGPLRRGWTPSNMA